MSTLRTSTSLITFGFAVYKFFQLDLARATQSKALFTAREFGITMIMIGLASLVLGVFEYRRDVSALRKEFPGLPRSTSGAVASLVAILGIMALIAALFRQ
jgi:putative membrane protein